MPHGTSRSKSGVNFASRRAAKKIQKERDLRLRQKIEQCQDPKTPKKKLKAGFFRNIFKTTPTHRKLTEADLINVESKLGASLFGPIPEGHRREFFRFQHNIWIFHESWEEDGKSSESTITYEVRENGVYKLPLGGQYIKIKGDELENFRTAVKSYVKIVKARLY